MFQATKVILIFVGLGPEVKGCLGAFTKMPSVYHEKRGLSVSVPWFATMTRILKSSRISAMTLAMIKMMWCEK